MSTTRILLALFLFVASGAVAVAAQPQAADSQRSDRGIDRLNELVAVDPEGGFQAFAVRDDANDAGDLKLGPKRKSAPPAAKDVAPEAPRDAAAPAKRSPASAGKSASVKASRKPVAIQIHLAGGANVEQA